MCLSNCFARHKQEFSKVNASCVLVKQSPPCKWRKSCICVSDGKWVSNCDKESTFFITAPITLCKNLCVFEDFSRLSTYNAVWETKQVLKNLNFPHHHRTRIQFTRIITFPVSSRSWKFSKTREILLLLNDTTFPLLKIASPYTGTKQPFSHF